MFKCYNLFLLSNIHESKAKECWESRSLMNSFFQCFTSFRACYWQVVFSISNSSPNTGCCQGFFRNSTTQKCERAFVNVINWAEKFH